MADRDTVIKSIENCLHGKGCDDCSYEGCIHAHGNCTGDLMADALELLKEQPGQKFFVDSDGKVTPLPIQKHGHWKVVEENYDDDQHWQCSVCGCEWYLEAGNPEENNMHYCPECGAEMDGEEKKDATT